ncbi:hypothetical protein ACIGO6_23985 [Streptomyces sp. NPDC053750]|uniref:hypothetical protein n=1 Tax=Streptomyces sp. NPDC053750 TaxID=3365714 RepID=UPI0037D68BEB
METAVEVVQLGVADRADLPVDQALLLGADGFEGVAVQDEAGSEDGGGFWSSVRRNKRLAAAESESNTEKTEAVSTA